MAVRNFYIKGNIDGKKSTISGGPRNKEGGMDFTIYIRNEGEIEKAFTLNCYHTNNKNIIIITDGNDDPVITKVVIR